MNYKKIEELVSTLKTSSDMQALDELVLYLSSLTNQIIGSLNLQNELDVLEESRDILLHAIINYNSSRGNFWSFYKEVLHNGLIDRYLKRKKSSIDSVIKFPLSLEELIENGQESQIISSHESLNTNIAKVYDQFQKQLSEIENKVFISKFLEHKKNDEIARSLNLTKKQVSDALDRIHKKIKKFTVH